MNKRRYLLPSAAALGACAMLASGCGGSSSGGQSPVRLGNASGLYYGVYRTDVTAATQVGGAAMLSIEQGKVDLSIGQLRASASDTGGPVGYTGTLSGDKATVTDSAGDTLVLTLTVHAATPDLTATYKDSSGATGQFIFGANDSVMVPLPETYAGTYSSTSGESGTLSVTIDSDTLTGTGTTSGGATFPIEGEFDQNGTLYLAYDDGAGFETSYGATTYSDSGAAIDSTMSESPSGKILTVQLQPGIYTPDPTGVRTPSVATKPQP